VYAGFGEGLVGEDFHFAVFQRGAVVGRDGAQRCGTAVCAHFVLEDGVIGRVHDCKRGQRGDGESFDELGDV